MSPRKLQYGIVISSILVSTLASGDVESPDDGDPKNGLSSQAFRRNALTTNQRALQILSTHPLNDTLLLDHDGYIARQLHDAGARAMAAEVIKCALNNDTTLSYVDPFDPTVAPSWKGELGLCQEWHEQAPTQACLELVTACVMARVNALGMSIPLWLRGYSSERPGNGAVPTVKEFRESPP